MRYVILPIVLISLTLAPIPAAAGPAHRTPGYYDQAKVVEVVPIREVVRLSTPHQECWTEEVEHARHYDDPTYTIAGSILGGVVGHQFGGGTGRHVATAAGSVLGAVIGHDLGHDRTYTTVERRCQTVNDYREEERIVGYRVTYDYGGRTYTTDMDRHPGRYVRVRVSVAPVE